MISLFEFFAEISSIRKAGIGCNKRNRFLCGFKLCCSLCQTILDQIGYRRSLNAGTEDMQRPAFAYRNRVCYHIKSNCLLVMIVNILHHGLQFCLSVI